MNFGEVVAKLDEQMVILRELAKFPSNSSAGGAADDAFQEIQKLTTYWLSGGKS